MVVVPSGWPADKRQLTPAVAMYYDIRDELVILDGLFFRGGQAHNPQDPSEAHAPGTTLWSSKDRIDPKTPRERIYWPNMKSDVKYFTSRCETRTTYGSRQQKETLISHDVPDRRWAKFQ